MKKQPLSLLLIITFLFCAFSLGYFLGKNQNHHSVHLTAIPTQAQHDLPAEVNTVPETRQPEISFPIDINSAGLAELITLPGIGETLAQRILDFRNQHGNFAKPEELMNVEGIGSGKLEAILDYIIAGG